MKNLKKNLIDFIEYWNNLPEEDDDKLYMTEETIDKYLKSINSDAKNEQEENKNCRWLFGIACHRVTGAPNCNSIFSQRKCDFYESESD